MARRAFTHASRRLIIRAAVVAARVVMRACVPAAGRLDDPCPDPAQGAQLGYRLEHVGAYRKAETDLAGGVVDRHAGVGEARAGRQHRS